jgi:hypothetical protein
MITELGKPKKTAGEKKYKEQSLEQWSSQPMEKRQKDNEGFWQEEAKWFKPKR